VVTTIECEGSAETDGAHISGLKREALTDAFRNVRARFEMECEVLEQAAEDFEIQSWNAFYSSYTEKSGLTKTHVTLIVSYQERGNY